MLADDVHATGRPGHKLGGTAIKSLELVEQLVPAHSLVGQSLPSVYIWQGSDRGYRARHDDESETKLDEVVEIGCLGERLRREIALF